MLQRAVARTPSAVLARRLLASARNASARADDLLDVTEESVSQVYCISKDEAKATFPQGLPKQFAKEVDVVGQVCWVLRRASYQVLDTIRRQSREELRDARFLLHGENGVGKSLCLHQVVHRCSAAGWLVLQVPSVFAWTHSGKELRPSNKRPGLYDQPDEAIAWLKNFKAANASFVSTMRLSQEHVWNKRDSSAAGEGLGKVIDYGLLKPILATEVVGVVIEEVARASQSTNVLLAVDSFNGCFNPTSLRDSEGDWLPPQQLSLVRCITEHVSPGKFPGAVVLSLSKNGMKRHNVYGHEPPTLLGEEGLQVVGECQSVCVPHFSRQEMETFLEFCQDRKFVNHGTIQDKGFSPTQLQELWHLTTGNPRELSKFCATL